jgi:CheY-like chemotaxis protein
VPCRTSADARGPSKQRAFLRLLQVGSHTYDMLTLGRVWRLLADSFLGKRQQLPAVADEAASSATVSGGAAADAAPPSPDRHGPMRVLVVEDDRVNQLVVMGMLRQMGHCGDCVADGAEALEGLTRQNYDLVLMDIRMPNMDGIEATQRVRRLTDPIARIPIIALTANATTEERLRCAEAGMNDFISKPFRRAELESALEKWRPPAGDPPARISPRDRSRTP